MERSRSLSEDLLEEILSRLPVKTLIRFKCVKKSWCNLFQNQRFIAKHHRHHCCSQHKQNPSLLVYSHDSNTGSRIYIMSLLRPHPDNDDDFDVRIADLVIRYNSKRISMRTLQPNLWGCINGVICIGGSFFHDFDAFFLWNPAIHQYKVVPYPTLPYCSEPNFHTQIKFAFGYDRNSNDYKVVRIVSYRRYTDKSMIGNNFVHVYTLSTDCWRQKIDTTIDHSDIFLWSILDAKYTNGVYYWHGMLTYTDEGGRVCNCEVILSFDMSHETFRTIRLPEFEFDNVLHMRKTFAVFNDCLALIFNDTKKTERSFHIWLMRESGIKESWTKQFVVGPLVGIDELPLGFVKNGELLLLRGDDRQTIVLYNIGSKEIKNLQFREFPTSWQTNSATTYVESLVSFTGETQCVSELACLNS